MSQNCEVTYYSKLVSVCFLITFDLIGFWLVSQNFVVSSNSKIVFGSVK